ncbi:MAG: flagellar export protein FliJ [Gammaproteobacteria bacterium]|jgi:flagellar FliJ protein|nr:flagellar export protein FliJ [Gammaproteobacteria bacterium]
MVKSERMQTVAGLARDREDQAAAALAQLRQQEEEQSRRLEELCSFRREYQDRMEQLGRQGIGIQLLNQYRGFSARLSDAIDQQQRLVEEVRRRLEQQRRSWGEASAKRRALDETVTRLRGEERAEYLRREQREFDDRAQRTQSNLE